MVKNGKIETKIFTKSDPIYLGPTSCHDPKVFKSIFRGVGLRIRLNCSQDEDFEKAVEVYSKSLAISGYKFQTARSELLKCKQINRDEYLKEEKERKKKKKTCGNKKVFWISKYDPRVPHPRAVMSKNYHILEGDAIAKTLFERKNLVAGSRRDKNLREIISPTVQKKTTFIQPSGPKLLNGSFQCENFKNGRKCELCSHMSDAVCFVTSQHFNTKHRIKGHLVHLPRDQKFKDRWFIYMIEDNHCKKQYVGSTTDMYGRWSTHKSTCNTGCTKTGLSAHFTHGCPGDTGRGKENLEVTLIDFLDVTLQQVQQANHGGVGCVCTLCRKLKNLEDTWMMRLGTFYHPGGLNKRDEIKRKVRVNY